MGGWLTSKVTQQGSDRAGSKLRLLLPAIRTESQGSEMEAAELSCGSGVKKTSCRAWAKCLHLSLPPFS